MHFTREFEIILGYALCSPFSASLVALVLADTCAPTVIERRIERDHVRERKKELKEARGGFSTSVRACGVELVRIYFIRVYNAAPPRCYVSLT